MWIFVETGRKRGLSRQVFRAPWDQGKLMEPLEPQSTTMCAGHIFSLALHTTGTCHVAASFQFKRKPISTHKANPVLNPATASRTWLSWVADGAVKVGVVVKERIRRVDRF
jgi:hypothetical protein